MFIPEQMEIERSPGYGELHTITCNNCGGHTRPIDLISDEQQARRWIQRHQCNPED